MLLSTSQAAKKVKVKKQKIVKHIQQGKLKATKIGWSYVIELDDLKEWAREQSK
jgi:excisionase family DNA binding protein